MHLRIGAHVDQSRLHSPVVALPSTLWHRLRRHDEAVASTAGGGSPSHRRWGSASRAYGQCVPPRSAATGVGAQASVQPAALTLPTTVASSHSETPETSHFDSTLALQRREPPCIGRPPHLRRQSTAGGGPPPTSAHCSPAKRRRLEAAPPKLGPALSQKLLPVPLKFLTTCTEAVTVLLLWR